MRKKLCPICGNNPLGRNKKACSMDCYAKLKTQKKTCVICGKVFNDPISNDTITCSPECSKINRQTLYKQGLYTNSLKKAHEMIPKRPLTGQFETHIHAKEWVIQSPDGKIYKCRNLKNWLRKNDNLLDGTVEQAWDGITKIKYSMQGKRKNKSYQWKGWRLITWGD